MTETKQKGILIKPENREQLEKMIEKAQSKARTRTLTVEYIMKHLEQVMMHLDIPKTRLIGVKVYVDPYAETFSVSYRGTPMSTQFAAEYTQNGWRVTGVYRDRVKTEKHETEICLTDAARQALLDRMTTCTFRTLVG